MSMVGISSKSSLSTSSLVEVDFWNLCKQKERSIRDLANGGTLLNKRQCLDLSYKLSKTTQNIEELLSHCGAPAVLFRRALENLHRYLEKAKVLVKQCREKDWCQASVFQSQNQNAFREILLDVSFCYNSIFEQVKSASEDWLGHAEDLRQSPMFMPATASDVYEDQQDLQKRLEELAKKPTCILRKRPKRSSGAKLLDHERSEKAALTQCLARYTLEKLKCTSDQSQVNALGTRSAIFWVKETEPSGTWGNYKLLGSGSGASGVCSTTWLGVPCAKKEFHAQASERFFLEEAGILAYLKHPCIVNFFCCGNGKEKGDRFIAMELMEKSLLDLIDQRDMHFSLPVVVDIILQIARGMCYLHEQGIAHRDLKPGNVVVNKLTISNQLDYFCVKLVDFGMSKTKAQVSKSNTISVRNVGTTRYRAPEVHPKAHPDGKGKANWFRADVYSFAITCAHVLSMKLPFGDMLMPMSELYTELINGRRPELSNTCPPELVILIRDCWNTNPYSRPSFVEVCTRLEMFRYKHIIEFRHLGGVSVHAQRMQERKIDYSTGFDFIEKKMKEQISVSRSFADDRKDEEGETNDTHGNNGNDSVSIVPSSRNHAHVRRSSSLTKFFYDFRVTLNILLEPLSNSMAFWTNQGRVLLSSLTRWVPIAARDNDLGEPFERSKSRVESKDLKPGRFLGQGCSGIFYEVSWSGLQSMDLLVRKDIPGVSGHVFEHEAARLVELEHPNIVKNYCWTVDKRSCTLVMEHVKDDLYSVVKKRGELLWKAAPPHDPELSNHLVNVANFPFKLLDAIPIMLELATGIEYLHSRGIPHGDLKPSNVLVDLESDPIVVKVADYGLIESKRMATLMSKQAFCFRMIEWSAPEVFEEYFRSMSEDLDYIWTTSPTGSDMSVASESYFGNCPVALQLEEGDSYSFGLICAFIISGQLWDASLSPGELRKRILSESLRPELPLECPKTLASLISSCWDVDPTCRPIFSDIRRKLDDIFLEQQEEEAQNLEKDVQQAVDLAQQEVDLAREACPSPCNRGCAPLECPYELPKSILMHVMQHEVGKIKNGRNVEMENKEKNTLLDVSDELTDNYDYLWVRSIDRDGIMGEGFSLSLSNLVRTISTSSQVEEVQINLWKASQETSRALVECLKTIPSLKSLLLEDILSSSLSVSDAEAIFSAFGPNSTLQSGGVSFGDQPAKAAIVKVLVDALVQNQVLRDFKLNLRGAMSSSARTEGTGHEESVMRELSRYLKAPTNVLTKLSMHKVDDDEVIELADTLGHNKKLQELWLDREDNSSHSEGIGRIGEALRTNTLLEKLGFGGKTTLGEEEMEALVGALVPDAATGLQPNTHLHTLRFHDEALQGREGMEQLATLLRSNTTLLHLDLSSLSILENRSGNAVEYVEVLFTALRFNTSLESLDLRNCTGVGGKDVLGMIMDMLLHNRSLREIKLGSTGLEKDGDAEVVYVELLGRGKTIDWELEKTIRNMEHVPPNSARVFLCGNPKAGKTTLCQRWKDVQVMSTSGSTSGVIDDHQYQLANQQKTKNRRGSFISKRLRNMLSKSPMLMKSAPSSTVEEERTRGIEVHKMLWNDMSINLWDMGGLEEYHTFHDMMLPNRSSSGDSCFYFIVCNPSDAIQHLNEEVQMECLKMEIYYWLVFIASNTRRSKSYLPHVTILMTHHDLWGVDKDKEKIFRVKMKRIINKLRGKFQLFLEFDKDLKFIEMENTRASCNDAIELKKHVLQYLKRMSSDLPKILKACVEFQSNMMKWSEDSSREPFVKYDVFSKSLSEEATSLGSLKDVGNDLLEKIKKHVAVSLHNGGHIMYFEEIDMVILDPHWFCQNIIGHILFNFTKLNDKGAIEPNGIISRQDFNELVKELVKDGETMYAAHSVEILFMMTKLQICYWDDDGKIMIPSLLDGNPIPTNWEEIFGSSAKTFTYVGLQLRTADESITKLTRGFFPRLQVFLRNKFCTNTYRLYSNTKTFKLFCKGISFIVDGVELFILQDMEDSINIISRCCGGGDSENRRVQKMILDYVNDFRQRPTLGCPGVIFEEHIIFPQSVENALGAKKLQCISKKQLQEEMVDKILWRGDFTYALIDWIDEKGVSRRVHAKELLGEKEWLNILLRRIQKVMDMDKVLESELSARNSNAPSASTHSNSDLVRKDSMKRFIADEFDSLKRLMQHNHTEVMTRLDELENNIMGFQVKLTSRVCSNIDNLMDCLLQLNNSNIPKLPYIMESAKRGGKRILLKMVPGLKSYQLHFMCEHRDGFHIVENQPGCEVEVGNDQTRRFGIVMYWGLTISAMLLKVGAHVTAEKGNMVPGLTREFATLLDTPGLLDLAQPRGDILACLPEELKKEPHISLQDNEEAKAWLVQTLGKKCPPGGMQRMFKLTQMVYTTKSDNKGGIAWVCDIHRDGGEQDGSLRRR